MASEENLCQALRDELTKTGLTNKINAEIRSEVLKILNPNPRKPPEVPKNTALITELIHEFLEFHHYKYSSLLLATESGTPDTPVMRSSLARQLGVQDGAHSGRLPLLYGIIGTLTDADRSGDQ